MKYNRLLLDLKFYKRCRSFSAQWCKADSGSYYQAYELIRGITGFGAGSGPIIGLHEGFIGVAPWTGFLEGADRM